MLSHRICTGQTAKLRLSKDVLHIGGASVAPDTDIACIEVALSHVFPVRTIEGTAIMPEVLRNSAPSMAHKMLNLGHLVRSYDPKRIPRDRILGNIAGVELEPLELKEGETWTPGSAPGMRCAAVLYRAAEGAETILDQFDNGQEWTVSMENAFEPKESGVGVKGNAKDLGADKTPEFLLRYGYAYWPLEEAPSDLLDCLEFDGSARVKQSWRGMETTLFCGGIDGTTRYSGIGLTPLGKEPTAEIVRVLAGQAWDERDWAVIRLLEVAQQLVSGA